MTTGRINQITSLMVVGRGPLGYRHGVSIRARVHARPPPGGETMHRPSTARTGNGWIREWQHLSLSLSLCVRVLPSRPGPHRVADGEDAQARSRRKGRGRQSGHLSFMQLREGRDTPQRWCADGGACDRLLSSTPRWPRPALSGSLPEV